MNCYNLDGIKTQLTKEIDRTKTILTAWEGVTFLTKKDGQPYKVLSKNIKGASLHTKAGAMSAGENKLSITEWSKLNGYVSDEIDCYNLVDYLTDETMKAKTYNYQPKQPYLKQIYTYDIQDIKQAVTKRIDHLKDRLNKLEIQMKQADAAYINFKTAYGAALKQLEIKTNKECDSTLYYLILDTIKTRYPFC